MLYAMIDLDKAKYFIVVGLFLLLLSIGKHYFPDIKNYLGFMWWAGLSSIIYSRYIATRRLNYHA